MINLKPSKKTGSIFFVTGRSCAGKSALWISLKRLVSSKNIALHDIDEEGVPSDGRQHWRPFRVELLYAQAVSRAQRGISTVIFGISLPHEVIDSSCFATKIPVHFILLEVSQKDFDQRMKLRLRIKNQTSMWPSIRLPNQQLAKTLYHQVINQRNSLIANSSKNSKRAIAKVVWNYIEEHT